MARSHDEQIQELRKLEAELGQPAISMGSIQRMLRVLVVDAIDVRETLKNPKGGQVVDGGNF